MSTATVVSVSSPRPLLRFALKLDALVTGANGAAYLALASVLDSPLGIPASTLRVVGAFLLVFAASVWFVSMRPETRMPAVAVIIGANVLWVIDSLLVAATDWSSPTTLGTVWIVLQAMVVAGFAALQAVAARR